MDILLWTYLFISFGSVSMRLAHKVYNHILYIIIIRNWQGFFLFFFVCLFVLLFTKIIVSFRVSPIINNLLVLSLPWQHLLLSVFILGCFVLLLFRFSPPLFYAFNHSISPRFSFLFFLISLQTFSGIFLKKESKTKILAKCLP